jgi:SulP family sulfate permease
VHLWRELRLDIDVEAPDEVLHLHPRGVIWFATAPGLEDRLVRVLADHPRAERLVVHLDGVGRLDHSGALALRNVLDLARTAGLDVEVDGVPPHARRIVGAMIDEPKAR